MRLKKNLRTIKIGHGAYTGANALKYVTSKAAAVRELRARGFKRDVAREAVNRVSAIPDGWITVEQDYNLTEIHAMNTERAWYGYSA